MIKVKNLKLRVAVILLLSILMLGATFQLTNVWKVFGDEDKHGVVDQHKKVHIVKILLTGFKLLQDFGDKGSVMEVAVTTTVQQDLHTEHKPYTRYIPDFMKPPYFVLDDGVNDGDAPIQYPVPGGKWRELIYEHCQCHGVNQGTPFKLLFHFTDIDGPSPKQKQILNIVANVLGEWAKTGGLPEAAAIINIINDVIGGDTSETIDFHRDANFLPAAIDPPIGQTQEVNYRWVGALGRIEVNFTVSVTTTNTPCNSVEDAYGDNGGLETGYGHLFSDIGSVLVYQNDYHMEAAIKVNEPIDPPDDVGPNYQLIFGVNIDSDGDLSTGPEYFAEVEYNVTKEESYTGGLWKNVGGWYEYISPVNFKFEGDIAYMDIDLTDLDELRGDISHPLNLRFYTYELDDGVLASDYCPELDDDPIGFSAAVPPDKSLYDFPEPFVPEPHYSYCSCGFNTDTINSAVVIGDYEPHGPCWPAQTIDVMGSNLVAEKLGFYVDYGEPVSYLDSEVMVYNPVTQGTSYIENETIYRNLLVFGGPGVNLVFRHYNELLPARFNSEGGWHIEIPETGETYWMATDETGRVVEDYGLIVYFHDKTNYRHILFVGGIGAYGTLAASKAIADGKIHEFISGPEGTAMNFVIEEGRWKIDGLVVKVSDGNGDGYLTFRDISEGREKIEIADFVPRTIAD